MKKRHNKVVYKEYTMGQLNLPMNIGLLIPENHLVREVNRAIEKLDLEPLEKRYKGGGTSSYHPKMMLKVLVYAYTQRTYSSRQIAKAMRENINFMWISGNNRPDFRTLNRFRSTVMKGVIEKVFAGVLEMLIEEGYMKLENYFLDGTKIEANARKYSYVWAKNTKRYKDNLQEKIKELLEEIERLNEAENEEYGEKDLEEMGEEGTIDAEKLEKKIGELNERLREKSKDTKLTRAVKKLEQDYLPRQKKYEEQEEKLNGRNSYSKTDEDATFMRMKEDQSRNGQPIPKAGYNIQTGTENQFVVGYSVHQKAGDTSCMIPHLNGVKELLGRLPKNIIADGGYGSEENYDYMEQEKLGNYVKYNMFHKEQKKKYKEDAYRMENLPYNQDQDTFKCPGQKKLTYQKIQRHKTGNGFLTERRVYECEDCSECSLKPDCTRAVGNRQVRVSFQLQKMRAQARRNLLSEEGVKLRSLRGVEVEAVFGQIKHNMKFRRFMLRGLEKVKIEFGLLCIAHNMAKLAA